MKKKVRIYKPTNKFDEGGQQATKFTPDQLISIYMTALSEPGSSPEDAENVLRQIGVDENSIASITDSVENYVDDEQYYNDALSTSDEDAYEDMTADQAAIDAAYQEEQNALALAEEEARSDRMQQMYTDYSEPDYGDDTDVANQMLMRVGGLPPKKTFLKNVIKQIKKQAGGPSENATADSTDPDNKRKEGLQAFTSAVQVDGDIHLAKEDAQRMYEMLATPVGQEESYYEEPDMDYAQFGGMRRGQQRRMNRRLNRIVRQLPVGFSGMPRRPMIPNVYDYTDLVGAFGMSQMPADGSYYRGPKMANIDVRRTGLFGRPKEYSITFADDVYQNPQTTANTAKQKVINKEEEIKDEVKAAEEGTVDQGVEEKKAEEATVAAEDDAPVDINDIQVVSGSRGNSGGGSNIPAKEKITASGPAFKGFWKGYDPKSVRFAGSNKDRAYIQRGSKWFVSPNFTTKDKKNVQWYEVSDPNRIKNIERNTRTIMDPLAPGTTYTISDVNSGVPLGNVRNSAKQYPTSTKGVSDKEIIEGLNAYVNRKIPAYARKYPPMMDNEFKRYFTPSNMNRPVSRTAARNTIGMGEKFQEGGFSDQDSGLFRFIDGGADQGKLTQDPYFAYGGLHKAQTGEETEKEKETPTYLTKEDLDNWAKTMGIDRYMMGYGMPQFRTKQKGLPYYTGTRNTYMGNLDNARLKSIDVKKSSWLTGMPKKYTVNYQVQRDPLSKRMSFDESGMKVDRQSMSDIAPTRQGMFNKGQRDQMFGRRPDTAFESRSRALSWLGSKLRPFGIEGDKVSGNYTPEEQKMLRKGYDPNTGLTQEELARRQNAAIPDSTFAFIQPPVADVKFPEIPNVPEAQLQNTSTANAPVAPATQAMSFRKPSMFPTNIEEAQIIPSNYGTADFSKGYVAPETMLEPDYGQAAVEGIQPSSVFQSTQPAEFTQPEQTAMSEDQYNSQLANQTQAGAQDFMLQQMAMQNPDYFNQGAYLNPIPFTGDPAALINLNTVPAQQIANNLPAPVIQNYNRPARNVYKNIVSKPKEKPERVFQKPQEKKLNTSSLEAYDRSKHGYRPALSYQERINLENQVDDWNAYRNSGMDIRDYVKMQQSRKRVSKADTNKVVNATTTQRQQSNVAKQEKKNKAYFTPSGSENIGGSEKATKTRDEFKKSLEQTIKARHDFEERYGVDKATLELFRILRTIKGTEAQQRVMLEAHPGLKKFYKVEEYGGYMAYGGTLPKAQVGPPMQEKKREEENAAIPDSTFAFIQPPVADVKFPDIPNAGTFGDMGNASLPLRKAQPIASTQEDMEPQRPALPQVGNLPLRKPGQLLLPSETNLEQGVAGPMYYNQASQEASQNQGYNLLGVPTTSEDYYNDLANQNQAAAQDFMLEQIRRQNPEYNQDVYNNPVFNPEEMTTGNIINLNPPIVTPQQLAETIEQRNNKVPTRRQVPSRVIPPKEQAPVVKKQPARLSIKKSNKYDYEQAIKGMSALERSDYQNKQAEGYDETREMKQEAVGDYPKVFRDTYKDYKIPSYIKNEMESLSPLEKAKYMKTLRKVDVNLYYALLNKYFQYGGYMAYGGDLPKAQMYNSQIGAIDPITQDPRFMANYPYEDQWTQADQVDWTETNPIPEDIGEEDMPLKWSQKDEALANAANVKTETGVDLIEGPKVDYGKKRVKVKYKNKEKLSGADRRMRLDLANAAGNRILDLVGQRGDREKERKLRERLLADNLYGSTSGYDRGTYEANSGLFRPDQMGFTGVIKYGGEANYQVGGETYMSEDQIRKFLEEGGELEFV